MSDTTMAGLGVNRCIFMFPLAVAVAEILHRRPGSPLQAFRANAVTELDMGMFREVEFQLSPGVLGIADFLAVGTNREQSAEFFDLGERPGQLPVGGFQLGGPVPHVAFQGVTPLVLLLVHLAEGGQGLFELTALLLQFLDQHRVELLHHT